MAKHPEFTLFFASEALAHLDFIEPKCHGLLRRSVEEQLPHQRALETRNRKPLAHPAPFAATWELRCGPGNRFRVFYEVDSASREVYVLAFGVKKRNRLIIGGEEYET